jgi:hypothetical protein
MNAAKTSDKPTLIHINLRDQCMFMDLRQSLLTLSRLANSLILSPGLAHVLQIVFGAIADIPSRIHLILRCWGV